MSHTKLGIQAENKWRIAPKETHRHDQHQWPCNRNRLIAGTYHV